jgi:hypothetical protein
VFAWNNMPTHHLDDDKGHDKPDNKKDARIDNNVKEVAVVFGGMGFRWRIVLRAHPY